MKKNYLLLFVWVVTAFVYTGLNAQQAPVPCATKPEKVEWLKRYQQNPAAYPKTLTRYYVPVALHIVGSDEGSGYFQLKRVLEAFCELNQDFEPADIQFYLQSIDYIANSYYYDYNDFGPGYQMMNEYNLPGALNCYIVQNPAGACGYSDYGTGVALGKSCIGTGDNTWAHEFGHYLSLPHPFYGWEGYEHNYNEPAPAEISGYEVELLDGSNCANSGDGFCDTQADYLANSRWGCNNENLSLTTQKDPTGASFVSDGSLYMSYSIDVCSSRFSDEQIAAMRANLQDDNAYLIANSPASFPVVDVDYSFTPIEPAQESVIATTNSAQLTWEPVPGATHYIVQVNPISTFSVVFNQIITDSPTAVVDGLYPNKKYFWRIRPYNEYSTCAAFSTTRIFYTSAITGIEDPASLSPTFTVFPNPLEQGRELHVEIENLQTSLLQVNVLDATGRQVLQIQKEHTEGEQTLNIPTSNLTAGVYWLRITHNQGEWQRKIVVVR